MLEKFYIRQMTLRPKFPDCLEYRGIAAEQIITETRRIGKNVDEHKTHKNKCDVKNYCIHSKKFFLAEKNFFKQC